MATDGREGGLSRELKRLSDGLSTLVREHMLLARVELREELRDAGKDAAPAAAAVPLLGLGFAFLQVAAALAIGGALGFVIVGGVDVLVGAVLFAVTKSKLGRRRTLLPESSAELKKSRAALKQLRGPTNGDGATLVPTDRATYGG